MLQFNPMNFIHNLKYMGIGLLGVFMIIAIVIGATYLIGYASKKIEERKKNKESDEQ